MENITVEGLQGIAKKIALPMYEDERKKYNSSLTHFNQNHGRAKNKNYFSFNKKKPLLPQIEKALAQVTKEDYCSYVQYLREDAQNIKHPLNEIANKKASKQENFMQYLYLLVSDSGILNDYLREGEEPKEPKEPKGGYTPEEREALIFSRMKKNVQLWDILKKHADILAGNIYEKTIQGEVLNDIDEITGKVRTNRRYESKSLGYGVTEHKFTSGVSILYENKRIETIDNEISELPQNVSKVLRILLSNTANKIPSEVFTGKIKNFVEYSKVQISVDDYLTYTRKADKKNAKKSLEQALNDLYNLSIDKAGTFSRHRWISGLDESRKRQGVYAVMFSADIMAYICSSHTKIHDFNMVLLTLSENQKLAYQLGRKLWYHYVSTQGEKGSNRLFIETLLKVLTEIPSVEEVRKTSRHLVQKIQEPMEKALDALQSIGYLNEWHYTKAKGEPIQPKEQEQATFSDWLGWYLEYELNLPPQGKYIEQRHKMQATRKKRIENARKANEAKQAKKATAVRKE